MSTILLELVARVARRSSPMFRLLMGDPSIAISMPWFRVFPMLRNWLPGSRVTA